MALRLRIQYDGAIYHVVNRGDYRSDIFGSVVEPAQLGRFRWSSLARFGRPHRPAWLVAADWLKQLGLVDTRDGWQAYSQLLIELAGTSDADANRQALHAGWAIGTSRWRQAVAKDHAHPSLGHGIAATEIRDLRHARWAQMLKRELAKLGKGAVEIAEEAKGAPWKRELAIRLRKEVGAGHGWIAEKLNMGHRKFVACRCLPYPK